MRAAMALPAGESGFYYVLLSFRQVCKVAQERSFLEPVLGQPVEPVTAIYRISHGDAHFWTMADVGHEAQLDHLKF